MKFQEGEHTIDVAAAFHYDVYVCIAECEQKKNFYGKFFSHVLLLVFG